MLFIETVRTGAAHLQGFDIDAGHHAQTARSLRAIEALVACEAQHVNALLGHVKWDNACRLRGVEHHDGAMPMGHASQTLHVIDVAGKVGSVVDGQNPGIGPEELLERVAIKRAIRLDRRNIEFNALTAQAIKRAQHGVMRCSRGDGVVAWPQQAEERNVERLGDVRREGHA